MELRELVESVRRGDMLAAREWMKEAHRRTLDPSRLERPDGLDDSGLALAAALAELVALRLGGTAPSWSAAVGPAADETWLTQDGRRHPIFAERCRAFGPEPLRRRRIYAFPDFLAVA